MKETVIWIICDIQHNRKLYLLFCFDVFVPLQYHRPAFRSQKWVSLSPTYVVNRIGSMSFARYDSVLQQLLSCEKVRMGALREVDFDEKQLGMWKEIREWEQNHVKSWGFTTFSATDQILVFSRTSPLMYTFSCPSPKEVDKTVVYLCYSCESKSKGPSCSFGSFDFGSLNTTHSCPWRIPARHHYNNIPYPLHGNDHRSYISVVEIKNILNLC